MIAVYCVLLHVLKKMSGVYWLPDVAVPSLVKDVSVVCGSKYKPSYYKDQVL